MQRQRAMREHLFPYMATICEHEKFIKCDSHHLSGRISQILFDTVYECEKVSKCVSY